MYNIIYIGGIQSSESHILKAILYSYYRILAIVPMLYNIALWLFIL